MEQAPPPPISSALNMKLAKRYKHVSLCQTREIGSSLGSSVVPTCCTIMLLRGVPHDNRSYYDLSYYCVLSALFCVLLNSHSNLFTLLDKETEAYVSVTVKR